MNRDQAEVDYRRIELAIHYIGEHHTNQPSLEEIATHVNMSPYHFQRLFTRWAGVSPKKFLQYLTLQYAKEQIREDHTLSEIADEAGLSGTSRLHDLFINMEGMTPGQYKKSGSGITIHYGFHRGLFGKYILAVTSEQRICALEFTNDEKESSEKLQLQWSESELKYDPDFTAPMTEELFSQESKPGSLSDTLPPGYSQDRGDQWVPVGSGSKIGNNRMGSRLSGDALKPVCIHTFIA